MKKLFTLVALLIAGTAFAQTENVGIGTVQPDKSAILDLSSSSKGFLLPRMSENQRLNIAKPAQGLQVYQTDGKAGLYVYNGKDWENASKSVAAALDPWSLTGNNVDPSWQYLGTTNNQPLVFRTNTANNTLYNERMRITADGKVGIWTGTPTEALEVGNGGGIKGKILSSFPRTYLIGKDEAGFHWFAADPTVSEPGNIMMGIRRDPTTDIVTDLYLAPAGQYALRATGTKVLIGDAFTMPYTSNDYSLFVSKGIITEKVKVALKSSGDWADYVFEPNYKLMSLEDIENFTKKNKHLPNVLSAEQMAKEGLDVHQTSKMFMEKIEELTLHIIELNKRIKQLENK